MIGLYQAEGLIFLFGPYWGREGRGVILMATIYKRESKNGPVWYLNYTVNGRRIKKKIGKSKEVAEIARKEIEVKMARHEIGIVDPNVKIKRLMKEFMDKVEARNSPATVIRYRGVLASFKDFLSKKHPHVAQIRQVDQKLIEGYIAVRNKIRKSATVNFELTVLKSMFKMAVRRDNLLKSPLLTIRPLKERDSKPALHLSKPQIEKLLETCRKEYFRDVLTTFLHTGMRKSELISLKWKDVNFKNGVLKVTNWKTYTSARDKFRVIPMSARLKEVLTKIRKKKRPGEFVFLAEEVGRTNRNLLRSRFIRLTKKADMPEFTSIHTLRHTFASHLVMCGVDLTTVQKLLGHASIETTQIYAHLAPDHLRAAMETIDY